MKVTNVCIIGGGKMGTQIAFQASLKNFNVTILSRAESSIEQTKSRLMSLQQKYTTILSKVNLEDQSTLPKSLYDWTETKATQEILESLKSQIAKVPSLIAHTANINEAVKDVDLIIEAIPEDKQKKSDLFKSLSKILPEKTLIATNSTTILPSVLADDTGRPDKFFCMHFPNDLVHKNAVDIMPQDRTNLNFLADAEKFSKEMGMEPIVMKKEKPGQVFNYIISPFLEGALSLWINDYADYKVIDQVWEITTWGDGPFKKIDELGLKYVYDLMVSKPNSGDANTTVGKICLKLKEMIDNGLLGMESGEGFYKYSK